MKCFFRSKNYRNPSFTVFAVDGGVDMILEEVLDENGKAYPLFNFGMGPGGKPTLAIASPEVS